MLRNAPGHDIEKDPDIAPVRFIHEFPQNTPLPDRFFFSGQQSTDGVNPEIPITVAAVQRRSQPDPVHSGFRQMIQYGDQPLHRSVGRCRVDTDLHQNKTLDPVRSFKPSIRPFFHPDLGIRLVSGKQIPVVDPPLLRPA